MIMTITEDSTTDGQQSADSEEEVDLAKRFLATLIDGVVVAFCSAIPIIGGLVGIFYFLVRDGLSLSFLQGRSLGKMFMGLQVVRMDGNPMDLETSVRRNWMFAVAPITGLLMWIPFLGKLFIPVAILLSIVIGLFEIYNLVSDDEGRRWGDRLAGTRVVEQQT